jgi:hypothetical protein
MGVKLTDIRLVLWVRMVGLYFRSLMNFHVLVFN